MWVAQKLLVILPGFSRFYGALYPIRYNICISSPHHLAFVYSHVSIFFQKVKTIKSFLNYKSVKLNDERNRRMKVLSDIAFLNNKFDFKDLNKDKIYIIKLFE